MWKYWFGDVGADVSLIRRGLCHASRDCAGSDSGLFCSQGLAAQEANKMGSADKAQTVHGMGSAANLLQLLYESQGNGLGYR